MDEPDSKSSVRSSGGIFLQAVLSRLPSRRYHSSSTIRLQEGEGVTREKTDGILEIQSRRPERSEARRFQGGGSGDSLDSREASSDRDTKPCHDRSRVRGDDSTEDKEGSENQNQDPRTGTEDKSTRAQTSLLHCRSTSKDPGTAGILSHLGADNPSASRSNCKGNQSPDLPHQRSRLGEPLCRRGGGSCLATARQFSLR